MTGRNDNPENTNDVQKNVISGFFHEEIDIKKRFLKNISIIFFLTFIFMTCYELLKQVLNPDISIWESHIFTIIVTSILAVLIASIPLLRTETLLQNLERERKEKGKMEKAILKANNKLNMLSSITRHDILNLLTVIVSYVELIKISGTIKKDTDQYDYLDRIDSSARNLNRIILYTRDYQNIGIKEPVWINIREIFLKNYEDNFQFQHYRAIPPEDGVEIYADSMFERVIYNLMENTARHSEKATFMRLSFHEEGKTGYLLYEDDGVGVESSIKEKIFDHTFGKNTGLGLFLTREILSITDIEITEEGTPGEGVCFRMKIPQDEWRRVEKQ